MFIGSILPALFLLLSDNAVVVSGNALTSSGSSANLRASSSAASSSVDIDHDHGVCDESFPMAPPPPPRRLQSHGQQQQQQQQHQRRLVAIPQAADEFNSEYYESGEYYAPLCSDGQRIDLRKLVRCVNDQCYDEEIGHCTYVCSWSKPTTPQTQKPTPSPTQAPEFTTHPLLMNLDSLPPKWRMNEEVRAAIIRYMRDRLEFDLEELGVGLELVELSYPGRLAGMPHALPLELEIKGPPDISDFALSYIMQVTRDANKEIVNNLKRLDGTDGDVFENVTLNFGTYVTSEIMEVDTMEPSRSPTRAPTVNVEAKTDNVEVLDAESTSTVIPWWVWLIVALLILILCCCCCFCCRYRRNKKDRTGDKNSSSEQKVNIFLQTQNRMMPKKKKKKQVPHQSRTSVAASRRPSQHRPRHPRDDQTRRTSRTHRHSPRDDQTRRTTRTRQTRQTRQTRSRDEIQAPATSIIIHGGNQADLETIMSVPESQYDDYAQAKTAHIDAETAVSALENADPPEEGAHAMVLYNPTAQQEQISNSNTSRDPTMYTDGQLRSVQTEPEGNKIMKKQSVFATGAMMNEVHREKEQKDEAARRKSEAASARRRSKRRNSMSKRLKESINWKKKAGRDPTQYYDGGDQSGRDPTQYYEDGGEHLEPPSAGYSDANIKDLMTSEPEGLTSDEIQEKRVSTKKRKSKKSKKKKRSGDASRVSQRHHQTRPVLSRKSSVDKLKATFTSWRAPAQNANDDDCASPIDISFGSEDSGYDSPSILTNHNPSEQVQMPIDDNPYYRNDGHDNGEHVDASHQEVVQATTKSSSSNKKKGQNKVSRRDSAGVSSEDESFCVESSEDEESNHHDHHQHHGAAGGNQRRGSESSSEGSESSYESV